MTSYLDDIKANGLLEVGQNCTLSWVDFWKEKIEEQQDLGRHIIERINDEANPYMPDQMARDALDWWTKIGDIYIDTAARLYDFGVEAPGAAGIPHFAMIRRLSSPDLLTREFPTQAENLEAVLRNAGDFSIVWDEFLQAEVNEGVAKMTLMNQIGPDHLPEGAYKGIVYDTDQDPPEPLALVDVYVWPDV